MWMLIFGILGVLILLGLLFLVIEILPKLILKIVRINKSNILRNIDANFKSKILETSFKMAASPMVAMVWEDEQFDVFAKIKNIFYPRTQNEAFKKYNYPRAFLLLGILHFVLENNNADGIEKFINLFDEFIDKDGSSKFKIDKVDQAPFGHISLLLYNFSKDRKYLILANNIFEFLKDMVDPGSGIIDYRLNSNFFLNDTIGLTIPFLKEFYNTTGNLHSLKMAEEELDFFIKYGIDSYSHLPTHGIEKLTKIKVGSANWGRGFGWYLIGLASLAENNPKYSLELKFTLEYLEKIKTKEFLWSQFPGSSETFDASTTTMILYSSILRDENYLNENQIFSFLKKYLTKDGKILQTSGDTFGFNQYSRTFGESELSQGMLLLILAALKKNSHS